MLLFTKRKHISSYLTLALLLFLTNSLQAQNGLRNIDSKLDSIFSHYDKGKKPGLSIAIIEKDKPTFFKSYGHANLEHQIKNTSSTLFNATDLSKQFTVFSILILQDQGKLNIQDNIKEHLPALAELPFEITLQQLMEQTSGLRDVMELKKWGGYQNGDVITKSDILAIIAKQKHLNFTPGSKFEYNRTGFVLLSKIIEQVSDMPFSAFVHQHIFTPLGMLNSVFVNTHTELINNSAYSYASLNNNFTKVVNNSSFVGGSNLYTSASDFAKWLQNLNNQIIGKHSFYDYIFTKIKLPDGKASNYTPGIFKEDSEGYWRIHLEGFDHGFTSYMLYMPEHDFSLVYFSNNMDLPHEEIKKSFWNWFNNDYSIPPVKPFTPPVVRFVNSGQQALQHYTGNYFFEDNLLYRKIILENDTLFYVRSETNRTPLAQIEGEYLFKMMVPGNDNVRISFKNQSNLIEFRAINPDNDYVTTGRKISFQDEKNTTFSYLYLNEAIGHTINLKNTNKGLELTIDNSTTTLEHIGANEYLPQSNSKVKYVKLKKDKHQKVTGVYLSSNNIKNLYYKLINE